MAASQVIRKLFPRPSFVPPESEVALEKVVFIDGYKSDHYELVSGVVFCKINLVKIVFFKVFKKCSHMN